MMLYKVIPLSLILLLAACSVTQPSQPTRFYHLPLTATKSQPADDAPQLTLVKVQLPEYLNRTSIVIRRDPTEMNISQLEQWAGSLADNITSVLQSQLRNTLPQWQLLESINGSHIGSSYQLVVNIHRFDGELNGSLNLSATWQLYDDLGELISQQLFSNTSTCGSTTSEMVQAMAEALNQLALDIARQMPNI